MKPVLTYELAMAAARDAANLQMRANGRKKWNRDDYNAACVVFEELANGNRLPREREYEAMRQAQIALKSAKKHLTPSKYVTDRLIDAALDKLNETLPDA